MISTQIVSVGSSNSLQPAQGFAEIGKRLANAVRQQEEGIGQTFQTASDPSSPLQNIPKHVQDQFRQWDKYLRTEEEKEAAIAVKKNITKLYSENMFYIRDKIKNGIDKMQLELAVKAISKTISSAQQLLSSQ